MKDYMTAIYDRFHCASEEERQLSKEIYQLHKTISAQLETPLRKMLLCLVDLEDRLREQVAIDSFAEGWRVADGVFLELNRNQKYSYVADEEGRARVNFETKSGGIYENPESGSWEETCDNGY